MRHFDFTHRVSANSRFLCGVNSCCVQFVTLERFENHLHNFHALSLAALPSNRCQNQDSSQFSCSIPNCDYKCNNKSTLRVHRKRKHGQELPVNSFENYESNRTVIETDDRGQPPSNNLNFFDPPDTDDSVICFSNPVELESNIGILSKDDVMKKVVHFYMSLNSKYHVPDSTIQYMINSLFCITKESNSIVGKEVLDSLRKAGIAVDEQLQNAVINALSHLTLLEAHSPQGPLRSYYIRKKTYTSGLFKYIAPKSLKLGLNQENEVRKYHIIPIKDTIIAMMEDDSVFEQYLETQNGRISQDEFIRDIHDGSLCKNHPVLSKDRSAIGILLDADDLEVASPLGAAKGAHKVTAVYFTLSNLLPWTRMKKDTIKLCMLVSEKDVAYFGLEKILEPLITELADLAANGLEIRGQRVKAVLLMLLGDNLGTHTWAGLVENFSKSKYFCRYCEESRVEWRMRWMGNVDEEEEESDSEEESSDSEDSSESEDSDNDEVPTDGEEFDNDELESVSSSNVGFDLGPWTDAPMPSARMRTPESYSQCLEESRKNRPSCDKAKGVMGPCELNKLKDFHWVGATPCCIAHDWFEGVLAYDTALALKYFKQKFDLTASHINSKIKSMKLLGGDQGSKPAKVKDGMKKLRGSAVQNWNFLRFLPFFVGSKIKNVGDSVWQMILLLTKVTRMLTSPTNRKSAVPDLKDKIHLYLKMRCYLFPNVPLRAKHHFAEHFWILIETFGCLMRVNTLGCESKHRFLKNTASAKKNFKNITKTLSEEHQLTQSAVSVESLTCNFPILEDATVSGLVNMCPAMKQSVISFFGVEGFESLACSEKVRFRGTWYRKGEVLVTNENTLQLCLIEHVFVLGKNCYAAGEMIFFNPLLIVILSKKIPSSKLLNFNFQFSINCILNFC